MPFFFDRTKLVSSFNCNYKSVIYFILFYKTIFYSIRWQVPSFNYNYNTRIINLISYNSLFYFILLSTFLFIFTKIQIRFDIYFLLDVNHFYLSIVISYYSLFYSSFNYNYNTKINLISYYSLFYFILLSTFLFIFTKIQIRFALSFPLNVNHFYLSIVISYYSLFYSILQTILWILRIIKYKLQLLSYKIFD